MIEAAQKNEEFSDIIKNADLILPDGVGIKLALKLNGINQQQIAGIEFSKKLIENASKSNLSVAFVGAKEEVINLAIEKLKEEYSNLNVAYKRNGYFKENEEKQIINDIKNSDAKLIFVALGAIKQEKFIKKCKEEGIIACAVGVGGSFDVWAGKVKRAPLIWQKLGLEWLYRTIKQPERFKRIFPTLPVFVFKVIMSRGKD